MPLTVKIEFEKLLKTNTPADKSAKEAVLSLKDFGKYYCSR